MCRSPPWKSETYGVLTGIQGEDQRTEALGLFSNMYAPRLGRTFVEEYISQTGVDALKGADILNTARKSMPQR